MGRNLHGANWQSQKKQWNFRHSDEVTFDIFTTLPFGTHNDSTSRHFDSGANLPPFGFPIGTRLKKLNNCGVTVARSLTECCSAVLMCIVRECCCGQKGYQQKKED